MDPTPLYPNLYHPLRDTNTRDMRGPAKHHNRTAHPTRYYLIDFGLSRKYNPDDGPPLEPPIRGGDKTVPEFQHSTEPCDPFPTDIYYLGNMIREDFLQVRKSLNNSHDSLTCTAFRFSTAWNSCRPWWPTWFKMTRRDGPPSMRLSRALWPYERNFLGGSLVLALLIRTTLDSTRRLSLSGISSGRWATWRLCIRPSLLHHNPLRRLSFKLSFTIVHTYYNAHSFSLQIISIPGGCLDTLLDVLGEYIL